MELEAEWAGSPRQKDDGSIDPGKAVGPAQILETIKLILAHPNVRSKESLVRKYDHEVQARTVIQGFRGKYGDAPTDGGVVRPVRDSIKGLTVTHGMCPRVGDDDTYRMALCAVDEAYRSHIALGGDPDAACALDNFCWPDPVATSENTDGRYKLAQLVRANKGLRDACIAYNLPLVSGKDSMKNDARVGGKKISVRPTLLVSLMGIVPDARFVTPSGFPAAGLAIVQIGPNVKTIRKPELGGSILEYLATTGKLDNLGWNKTTHFGRAPTVELEASKIFYRSLALALRQGLVASIHDISDGGLAVTLAESSFHQRIGADITLPEGAGAAWLFAETPSRFLCGVETSKLDGLREILGNSNVLVLGATNESGCLTIDGAFAGTRGSVRLTIDQALDAWKTSWQVNQ